MSNTVPEGWALREAETLYTRLRVPRVYDRSQVSPAGKYPVIDQSESGCIGYLNSNPEFSCDEHSPLTTFANHTCAVRQMTKPFGVIQNVFPLKAQSDVSQTFLFQILHGAIPQDGYKGHYPQLRETQFLTPPLPEQQKIAAILSSVDDVIEKTRAQIDKLKDLKTGMMQELLTKGIGSGGVPHTEFKDSPVGRIPVGWDIVPISDHVLETRSGASLKPSDFSSEGFEVIPKKAVQFGGILVVDSKTYCTREYAESNPKNWVNRDCMVTVLRDLVPTGPSIGLIVEIDRDGNFLMAQGVYGFKLDDHLHGGYLAQLSNSDWYRREMRKILVGSTQVHIRSSEFFEVLIPKPPIDEQVEIHKALSSVDTQVSKLDRKVASLKSVKKGLLQDLLTGNIRVKVD